ncbi:MAG: transposase [Patescibacteria group bacterium]
MNTLHGKSPCCQAKIYKFGGKRKQCSLCKKTWSIRKKKRGRKSKRVNPDLLRKVLAQGQKMSHIADRKGSVGQSALSRQLRKAMMAKTRSNEYPIGWLVLIADALWFELGGQRWTLYLFAVRSTTGGLAYFLDPVLLPGRETGAGWTESLASIPSEIENRVLALVSDGFRGLCCLAKQKSWVIQRCHFHLLAQFKIQLGFWKKMPDHPIRKEIYDMVCKLLKTKEHEIECSEKLYELLTSKYCPHRYREVGMEFLRRLSEFRSYLKYPELHLPHTTGCIESFNKIIRDRCKYARTPEALNLRVISLTRIRTTITCNHINFQQN